MTEEIPPLRPPDQMPPIRSQADLHQHWCALMGELGFGTSSLWLQFITAEDRADHMLVHIDELPDRPVPPILDNLLSVCAELLELEVPGGRAAFLYARPGSRLVTEDDRCWARELTAAARRAGVPYEPVHLATDEQLRAFAPDDLGVPDSAA